MGQAGWYEATARSGLRHAPRQRGERDTGRLAKANIGMRGPCMTMDRRTPPRSDDMHSRFIPRRANSELRCDRTTPGEPARKLRSTCNCEERRTRHAWVFRCAIFVEQLSCFAVPHRVQAAETDRRRIAGSITNTRRCQRVPPLASARASYRPVCGTRSQYQIITDAICCELQSRQPSRTPIVGVQLCHPTSRRRGRVAGPS